MISLTILEGTFTIHKLAADVPLPSQLDVTTFTWIARTDEELSIVCSSDIEISAAESNPDWACFKVLGPLDFSLTGILAGITDALAAAEISIFALSTFDTDYILVKSSRKRDAEKALLASGYHIA